MLLRQCLKCLEKQGSKLGYDIFYCLIIFFTLHLFSYKLINTYIFTLERKKKVNKKSVIYKIDIIF